VVPNINALMTESVYFTRAFSVGPNTPNSYPSTFGYVYPSETSRLGEIPRNIETVPQVFHRNGYNAIGLNAGNAWLSEYYGYNRGFNRFKSYLNLSNMPDSLALLGKTSSYGIKLRNNLITIAKKIMVSPKWNPRFMVRIYRYLEYLASSENIVLQETILEETFRDDLLEEIKKVTDPPFFIWAHFMTTHWPFVPSKQEFSKGIDLKKANYVPKGGQLTDLYDDCVVSFDDFVGEIVDTLKSHNLYDDTIIIIFADHGELLGGDHKVLWYPSHPSELLHELLHVPLIIKFDDSKIRGQKDDMFSLIGLMPSIFDYLGIKHRNDSKTASRFEIQENDLFVKDDEYIFCEARNLEDAFNAQRRKASEVDSYQVISSNSFFEYKAKSRHYEQLNSQGEKQYLATELLSHIKMSRVNREKHKIKHRVSRVKK